VPPVNEVAVVRVDSCPRSTAVGLTEIVGNDRAALTVTATKPDVAVKGELELSVTWSSKDQEPTVARTPVEVDWGDVQAEELPRLPYVVAPGAF
jgi:hypothetical protein